MPNAAIVNFSAGETSPKSRGRFDLPWYATAAKKLLNFIAEISGPARYRPGFKYVRQTRGGAVARLVPFQLNNAAGYMLVIPEGYRRVYKNGDILTSPRTTITGITRASPATITVASTANLVNGNEIIITDIVGMSELNGRQVKLANQGGNTFQLLDPVTGGEINSTNFGAWVSGGTVVEVYEIASPYLDGELDLISWAVDPTNSVMYLAHPRYVPYKLTVDAADGFVLSTYARTNDPFAVAAVALTVTDVRPVFIADPETKVAATLTPSAVTGTGIDFTASAAIFTAADIGKYLWSVPTGAAGTSYGRARITGFTSSTVVNCTILTDFNGVGAIAAGDWILATAATLVRFSGAAAAINPTLTYAFSGVTGATQINGNSYSLVIDEISGSSSPRCFIRSALNEDIDSTSWGAYAGGGSAVPASSQPSLAITGITRGAATFLTFAAGTAINENVSYVFSAVLGTTQINGGTYRLKSVTGVGLYGGVTRIYLRTLAGAEVDSSAWTAYISGGIATVGPECPLTVAFYESRLVFLGSNQRPNCMFASRSPDSNGNPRYDDYTGGTADDNAWFYALAPVNNQINYIVWGRSSAQALFIGTTGGPFRVSGGGFDTPITPTNVVVRQVDTYGCEATPAAGGSAPFYIQRGGTTLRVIKAANPYLGIFESADLCLNAEQIPYSPLKRVVIQLGRPNALWLVREDGILAGMTVNITEGGSDAVTGWHRHKIGGVNARVVDAQGRQRADDNDQLWIVSERLVNSVTRRCVEIQADDVAFPDPEDFYSGIPAEAADLTAFRNAVYTLQERYVHLDAAGTYNGSDRGILAAATLSPGAITGTAIHFHASAAVFLPTDVGSELWLKPDATTGAGSGRALITSYVSSTDVICTVLVNFSSADAIAAGSWHIAANTISGLWHLEGARVAVVIDGAVYSDGKSDDNPNVIVVNGAITLTDNAAVVHVGLPYEGFLKTHNLEMGGRSGPAQDKQRNISEMFIRFMNTLGVDYGTDVYETERIEQRDSNAAMNRPAPVFSGIRKLPYSDKWTGPEEKSVVIVQRLPLPCIVQFIDLRFSTTDEG